MSDIIDFRTEKTKKDTDADQMLTAPDGSTWFKYTASYNFKCDKGWGASEQILEAFPNANYPDGVYSIEFWAQSQEEAQARIEAMKLTLQYDGQITAVIPA